MPRAGLDAAVVTAAAAAVADEIGLSGVTMQVVADRLGVKAPSLYKHVGGLDDLRRRIAVLAATEVGDDLRDAMQGRAGKDALRAAAGAVRRFVEQHPGRWAATVEVQAGGPDDPLTVALERTLVSFAAALRDYRLDPARQVHALRMLRSVLQGFAALEAAGGFRYGVDVDASFDWIVDFLDRGLRSAEA